MSKVPLQSSDTPTETFLDTRRVGHSQLDMYCSQSTLTHDNHDSSRLHGRHHDSTGDAASSVNVLDTPTPRTDAISDSRRAIFSRATRSWPSTPWQSFLSLRFGVQGLRCKGCTV